MVRLRCESAAERLLIPAFVFFFADALPVRLGERSGRATAAAAGGCMLVRREALRRAGGLERIADALIDDCALGALMKAQGPIWLGLTDARAQHAAPIRDVGDIRADGRAHRLRGAGLFAAAARRRGRRHGGDLSGAAAARAVRAGLRAQVLGLRAWAAMAVAYLPMLRFYRLSPLLGPGAAGGRRCSTSAFTLDSAWQHARGRGGAWKGRFQAASARAAA